MRWYFWEEWGIDCSQSTISRFIKKRKWNRKKVQRIGNSQSEELRLGWKAQMLHFTAEQLIFIDETLFNETTGWRSHAYAPIGQPARYQGPRSRGRTWSVLPAYTVHGYLPCIGIREGYYNGDAFYQWLEEELLPQCNAYLAPRSVIVMDNVGVQVNPRIEQLIQSRGCQVRYLPPYSPDYSPIELSFSVVKAWIRRHFDDL